MKDKKKRVSLSESEWSWIRLAVMDGIAAYQKASFPAIADEIEKVFAELLRQAPRPLP